MHVKTIATGLVFMVLAVVPATAGEIRGSAEVIDGKTMVVDGHTVQLADIVVPAIGSKCVWRGRPLDCGVLASAGLKDITAGANIVCTEVRKGTHRCRDGTFDLAFGLIHAGWAVPDTSAPDHYFKKMQNAKEHRRALWGAHEIDGNTLIAAKLKSGL